MRLKTLVLYRVLTNWEKSRFWRSSNSGQPTSRITRTLTQVCLAAAPYFRSLVEDGIEGLIRNRDNASPRFWMNASD
jgi:hypothetical protein